MRSRAGRERGSAAVVWCLFGFSAIDEIKPIVFGRSDPEYRALAIEQRRLLDRGECYMDDVEKEGDGADG